MEKVVLAPGVEADFHGFQSAMEVCDSHGNAVGLFLPLGSYQRLLATMEIPYSKEELERRRQATSGSTLQEFWQRMEIK